MWNDFNQQYFENGIQTGVSLYENYHWIPERSFKEAHHFIEYMGIKKDNTIIDYGCAKGFFVKALTQLGYNAIGFDISQYALENCEPEVKGLLFDRWINLCDYGLCKDVLEHCLDITHINEVLLDMQQFANEWLIVVPLGEKENYNVEEYSKDITHHIKWNIKTWCHMISQHYTILDKRASLFGIKDNWNHRLDGNLFIRCK